MLEGKRVSNESGLALIATLMVVVLIAVIAAAALWSSMSVTRAVNADYRGSRAFYAAEAGAEGLLSQIEIAVQDGKISDAELAAMAPPSLEGFDYTGYTVERADTVRIEPIEDGGYAGLYSLTQDLRLTVPATDPAGHYAAIELGVKAQAIPIFQFGVFYEEDLESHPSPPMYFLGRVHSNGNIYLSSSNAWYYQPITTPNEVIWGYKSGTMGWWGAPAFANRQNGVYIRDASGNDVALDFDSRDTPDPQAFKALSNDHFDDRLQTNAYGLDSLNLPLPEGIEPREIVRPRDGGDSEVEKETKFAWLADMLVTVDLTNQQAQSSVCGFPAGGNPHPTITVQRPGGGAVPDAATMCRIFDFGWERFFDSRDSVWVDAMDLDITELRNWASSAGAPEVIYVDIRSGPVTNKPQTSPNDTLYYPILRIKRGAQLPGPLTIATEYPLYIWGDYNTIAKQPAAVAGDSYSVLSNPPLGSCPNGGSSGDPGWCDADHQVYRMGNSSSDPYVDRTFARATQVFTAILAGHSPTTCDIIDPTCDGSYFADIFGGGLENYPRMLENWSGIELLYRGSIVSLWPWHYSKILDGNGNTTWICCSDWYYRPPIRNWGFDVALLYPDSLPPATPVVGSVLRTAFREASY